MKFWRIIFQSFSFKLAAILMALLLWFHVATDKVYEHGHTFPLEILNVPERLILAEEMPHQIEVKVRGKGKELLKLLLAEEKSVSIDAQEFKRGETDYSIAPEQVPIPEGLELRVTGILPSEKLKVWLDYSMEKNLKVKPDIQIVPAEGFDKVGDLHYNPQEVTISGPRMWVKDLQEISTRQITIEDADGPVSDQVDLVLPEGYNLLLSSPKVNFSQNVERIAERKISRLPVELTNVPRRREITIQPDSIDVTLSGAQSLLQEIGAGQLRVTVDCRNAKKDETVKLPVEVKLPAKVSLKQALPDSIKATMK
jgi:YbbR domain-containing protein